MRRHWSNKFNWSEMNMDGLRNTKLGDLVQSWLDYKLKRKFDNLIKIERAITIPLFTLTKKPLFLTGRIDHLFTPKHSEDFRFYYPIEAKYLVNKSVDELKELEKNYLFQPHTYMMSMGAQEGKIYFVDHNLRAKTFTLKLDLDIVQEGFDRIIALHDWVKQKEEPPAEAMYADEKWLKGQCWFCPIRRKCYKKEKKEID